MAEELSVEQDPLAAAGITVSDPMEKFKSPSIESMLQGTYSDSEGPSLRPAEESKPRNEVELGEYDRQVVKNEREAEAKESLDYLRSQNAREKEEYKAKKAAADKYRLLPRWQSNPPPNVAKTSQTGIRNAVTSG